jgi:MFS family permease
MVTGIGVGILTSTVGLWQAETSPAHSRGRYMTLELFLGAFGLFLSQWINYGFRNDTGRTAFVFPICFQLIFIFVTAGFVVMLPESPRWLAKNGRSDEALSIIARLEGKGATRDTPSVKQHLLDILGADMLEGREKLCQWNFYQRTDPKLPSYLFRNWHNGLPPAQRGTSYLMVRLGDLLIGVAGSTQ